MTKLTTKIKRIIAGAGLVALSAFENVDATENNVSQAERLRIDRNAENFGDEVDRLFEELANRLRNKDGKQTERQASSNEEYEQLLKLEEQFKKSPYLYQKYKGYIDRYIKAAKTLNPAESKKAAKEIAELDKKYFNSLCEDSSYGTAYNSEFVYDTKIENGERHLVHNKDSYVLCGPENSDFVEVFRFNPEDKSACYKHKFGQDTVYSCKEDNDNDDNIDTLIQSLENKPISSLKKANDKKIAMVQSMLYVKSR